MAGGRIAVSEPLRGHILAVGAMAGGLQYSDRLAGIGGVAGMVGSGRVPHDRVMPTLTGCVPGRIQRTADVSGKQFAIQALAHSSFAYRLAGVSPMWHWSRRTGVVRPRKFLSLPTRRPQSS